VINGEGFTLWEEHFERLGLLMRMWAPEGRRLLTVVRAYHHYFSDVYMLPILRRHVPTASPVMDVIEKLCVAFLEDRLEEGLEGVKTRPMEIEWFEEKGKSKQRLVGDVADVVVH
jgi:platelet-activating factor acetylhydrolase